MPFSFSFRFYYFSKYLLSHLYEYLIITEGFGLVWSIGFFPSFFLCELSFWGSSDKIATHGNLLRHIMHSTFSYFLSIPGQKTRHKVSELDVFVQIYERWYYWKMKRVFTHNAEKSIFPISLNSHGEYSGVHAASGFMSHSPWGLQSRVKRLKTRRNSFMISWFSQISNTPTHFSCHFHSPVVRERNEARGIEYTRSQKRPF